MIVAGYHYWGEAVLDRLRGHVRLRDLGQRERQGLRRPRPVRHQAAALPADRRTGVYLASEKKALLPFAPSAHAGDAGLDTANLSHYLTLQYVPEPDTLHHGISRIGSGECLTYTPGRRDRRTRRYYRPEFRPTPGRRPEPRSTQRIQETLRESVRLHMRSDVPVGAFLSSGIDSTAVVALAREFNPNILTFTVGYDVPGYSEIDVAQESARAPRTSPRSRRRSAPQDMMDALPQDRLAPRRPGRRPGAGAAVLRGQEGGRARHRGALRRGRGRVLRRLHDLPRAAVAGRGERPARRRCSAACARCREAIPEGVKGKSFLERGTTPIEERYYGNARIFTEEEKQRAAAPLRPDGALHRRHRAALRRGAPSLDDVTTMQYVDLYTWLRGDILVKADRMSMAHSLELRVPFLDREVFEVAADDPGRPEAAAALDRHEVRPAPGPGAASCRRPSSTGTKLGFPTPTRVWLAGRDVRVGARHPAHAPAPATCSTCRTRRAARGAPGGATRTTPARSGRCWSSASGTRSSSSASLDPGVGRNQSALLTKPVVGSMVS